MSLAFDRMDHNVWINSLKRFVGISDVIPDWFTADKSVLVDPLCLVEFPKGLLWCLIILYLYRVLGEYHPQTDLTPLLRS